MGQGRYLIGITGASGAVYGRRLVEVLLAEGHLVEVILTVAGKKVVGHELGIRLDQADDAGQEGELLREAFGPARFYSVDDLFTPPASGSVAYDGLAIAPCSMGTLAAVATGASANLLQRAADVALKEGWPLVLVPRETPLNKAHLRNLLTAAELGARIVPAMPAFYHHPQSVEELVDFVVGRVLRALGLEQTFVPPWGEQFC